MQRALELELQQLRSSLTDAQQQQQPQQQQLQQQPPLPPWQPQPPQVGMVGGGGPRITRSSPVEASAARSPIRSGSFTPTKSPRANPFEAAAAAVLAAQQPPPPPYTPPPPASALAVTVAAAAAAAEREAPPDSRLHHVARERPRRAQHSPPSVQALRTKRQSGGGWRKLDRSDRPSDPRFALAQSLERIPPPPAESLDAAGLAAARARSDAQEAKTGAVIGGRMGVGGRLLVRPEQYVVRSSCTVRSGPDGSSAEVGKHREGTVLEVIQEGTNAGKEPFASIRFCFDWNGIARPRMRLLITMTVWHACCSLGDPACTLPLTLRC